MWRESCIASTESNHAGRDLLINVENIDANHIDTCTSACGTEQEAGTARIADPTRGRSGREAEAVMNIQNRLITTDLRRRAELVASIAAAAADKVDRETKFPDEAIAAARAQRLLGILVPAELGGEGASISDVVDVCYALGRACASAGMIYAMHQMMVAALVRHAGGSAWHRRLLRRIGDEQLLLASSTTEGQGGGDLRKSSCAVERRDARMTLEKSATVISYGAQADVLLTTARRSADAPPTDQVLVALAGQDYRLEPLVGWDTLGMRGTCSAGFMLKAEGEAGQVLPEAYHKVHAETVMPVAHLAWGAVWAGIAAAAVERARRFVRQAAGKGAQTPPGAQHFTRASATLVSLRWMIASALRRYEAAQSDTQELQSFEFQTSMNLLKVNASEMAISAVTNALQACGLAGYRNDGEFSIGRHLRDVLSSSIMISNDRILANVAATSFLVHVPAFLTDQPRWRESNVAVDA
jgi:acyl-CoA dehydrogenase